MPQRSAGCDIYASGIVVVWPPGRRNRSEFLDRCVHDRRDLLDWELTEVTQGQPNPFRGRPSKQFAAQPSAMVAKGHTIDTQDPDLAEWSFVFENLRQCFGDDAAGIDGCSRSDHPINDRASRVAITDQTEHDAIEHVAGRFSFPTETMAGTELDPFA